MSTKTKGKDPLSTERRSWNMSRIRGKDTTPEIVVRSALHRMGYRFRLHVPISIPEELQKHNLPTTALKRVRAVSVDIVLPKYKIAVFVHGCFWHRHKGCKNCTTPSNRQEFWLGKLNGNAARDRIQQSLLRKVGWSLIVIWECETKSAAFETNLQKTLAHLVTRVHHQ